MTSSSEVYTHEHDRIDRGRFSLWPLPELHTVLSPTGLYAESTEQSAEEDAYERGVAHGRAECEKGFAGEVEQALRTLAAVGQELQAFRADWMKDMQKQIFVLAMAVAREVIQQQVETDPSIVHDLVCRVLDEVPSESRIKVRLHPDDLAAVRRFCPQDDDKKICEAVAWVADDTLERADCVVDTSERVVDARLETVLVTLHERLTHD